VNSTRRDEGALIVRGGQGENAVLFMECTEIFRAFAAKGDVLDPGSVRGECIRARLGASLEY
jgi:hypothetical protein